MAIADRIPTLDDAALANLRDNAARLGASGAGQQQKQAMTLLPLIEAELASRKAAKPKPTRAAKKKAPVQKDEDENEAEDEASELSGDLA
jgi:hypothetical protein